MVMPLEGIKVLDLTGLLPGPYCTMTLGDYGAEIIKIEQPRTGDNSRQARPSIENLTRVFLNLNRNKKSLTLDLKSEKGQEIFYKLADGADVVVEGFRPGVVKRLNIDYETISTINHRIIYCSLTGFGQTGPYALLAGHDLNYISYAGVLGISGRYLDAVPGIPAFQIGDIGGAIQAVNGILLALLARRNTGKGQYVDIAIMDGVISGNSLLIAQELAADVIPGRVANKLTGKYGCYYIYQTKDGKFISLGAIEPHFWARVCRYFDREDYIENQYNETVQDEIFSFLQEKFLQKDRDEWIEIFKPIDVCMAPILSLPEIFQDPQVLAREMIFEMDHPRFGKIKQVGFPVKLSATSAQARMVPPELGQHNQEILTKLGYSNRDIESFRQAGIV